VCVCVCVKREPLKEERTKRKREGSEVAPKKVTAL